MRKLISLLIGVGGLAIGSPAMSATTVLDFTGNICGMAGNAACANSSVIGQNYGDSAEVNLSYRSLFNVGTTNTTLIPNLYYWTSGYGDLNGVIFGGNNAPDIYDEITFTPTAGFEVSLRSFDAGCYLNSPICQTFIFGVLDGVNTIAGGTSLLPAGGHSNFAINSNYSTSGIILRWQAGGTNTGLDNINFDVRAIGGPSGVPEPANWALMIAGFGLVGSALRNRNGRRRATRPTVLA